MKESFPNNSDAIITRHSIRGENSEYEGLSPEGIEKAKERAKDFVEIIEKSEPGTVIFFGGGSTEARTTSTLEVYVDETKSLLKEKEGVLFFDQESISEKAQRGHLSAAEELKKEADDNPEAKVVVDLPLVIKDFLKDEWWYEEDGTVKEPWQSLLDKHGKDYSSIVRDWFETQGMYDGEQKVPKPIEVAESYLNGIKRLQGFVRKFSGDRNVKVVVVGHSIQMDALLTYLANDGVVDLEGFENIGDKVVDTTEMSVIEPDEDGGIHLSYRGKEFIFGENQ